LLALLGDLAAERLQAGVERGEVTDGLGLRHRGLHLLDRRGRLVGCEGTRGDALLEQLHLEGQVVVALGVERHRLLRRGVGHLPDLALPVRGADVDRAVLGHAAPRLRRGVGLGAVHRSTSISLGVRATGRAS
jgi:hypothetical protein